MNTGDEKIITDRIEAGVDSDIELIELWQDELKSLIENDGDKEKIERLKCYIKKAEECLIIELKAAKIMKDLIDIRELRRYS